LAPEPSLNSSTILVVRDTLATSSALSDSAATMLPFSTWNSSDSPTSRQRPCAFTLTVAASFFNPSSMLGGSLPINSSGFLPASNWNSLTYRKGRACALALMVLVLSSAL